MNSEETRTDVEKHTKLHTDNVEPKSPTVPPTQPKFILLCHKCYCNRCTVYVLIAEANHCGGKTISLSILENKTF